MEVIARKINKRRTVPFVLASSIRELDRVFKELPTEKVYKAISLHGGVASISFINWVAKNEVIEELHASTLRIGQKQFMALESMSRCGRLKKATFYTSKMMVEVDRKLQQYNYAEKFMEISKKNGWENVIVNNHSKVILMRTKENYYVLETSSNLNENPKIEQYSFENNKELYEFYCEFFEKLKEVALNE